MFSFSTILMDHKCPFCQFSMLSTTENYKFLKKYIGDFVKSIIATNEAEPKDFNCLFVPCTFLQNCVV